MRGDDGICGSLFSYINLEKRVRADHPLRVTWQIANAPLKSLSADFGKLYSPIGRGSIPSQRPIGQGPSQSNGMCLAEFSVYSNLKPCASTDRISTCPR
jgi:hypothetical protein